MSKVLDLNAYIQKMPKVELHVHLEGSTQPESLLALAKKYHYPLPVEDLEGVKRWFTFADFDHFIEIYLTFSKCLRAPEDIEWIARQFLNRQAEQNILYTEFTYTAFAQYYESGISFEDQLSALNNARDWASSTLRVESRIVIDIPRIISPADGDMVARWAVSGMDHGVVALGLGGPEVGHPPEKFTSAFKIARDAGLPSVPHAGETMGPESIWGALNDLNAVRIGHGVRCLEDLSLVNELRERQVPLEVCPTSNVCLKVARDMESHPLPKLLKAGLFVTINSDDPPMFNTNLTNEYIQIAKTFGYDQSQLKQFVLNGVDASLLGTIEKNRLLEKCATGFGQL
jgi:adenosine deaminase